MTSSTKLSRRRLLRDASVALGATTIATAAVESAVAATADSTSAALRRAHPASAQDIRQVSFMSPGSLTDQQIFQDAIAAAQEESLNDLGIQINWNAAPGGDWERIMTMFTADQAYDIQRIDDDRVYLLALENKIHQLDPWMLDPEIGMDQAAYYPRFFSSLAIEGYQFGMIPASSANVVYYNRDHFEQAGIEPPTTWVDAWSLETFLENVRALAGVSGQYGVVFPANVVTPIGHGAGGTALNEDQTSCAFDSDAVEAGLQPFVTLVVDEQVANPPEVLPLEMFNSGLASMMWGAMDNVAAISETINWGIMPWCATPEFAMTENYDRAWVISKSAPDPEAAYIGLKALTEKAPSDIWGRTRFGVPNLIASAEGEAFNDPSRPPEHPNVWSETFGDIDGHGVDVILPRGPIGDAWKGNFTGAELYGSLFSGQITVRQFLDEGCTRVNDEIARLEWNAAEGLQRLIDGGGVTDPDAKVLS